jgi:hypothetical protein
VPVVLQQACPHALSAESVALNKSKIARHEPALLSDLGTGDLAHVHEDRELVFCCTAGSTQIDENLPDSGHRVRNMIDNVHAGFFFCHRGQASSGMTMCRHPRGDRERRSLKRDAFRLDLEE